MRITDRNRDRRRKVTEHMHLFCVRTISFGASISSIIMLSRVNELRFSVLDLSELKERRLGVVAVEVTDYQDNSHNDGEGRWGEEEEEEGGGVGRRVGVRGGSMKVNRKNKHKHIKMHAASRNLTVWHQQQPQGKKGRWRRLNPNQKPPKLERIDCWAKGY